MHYKMGELISESKVIGFFREFNKNILTCFRDSKTYGFFITLNSAFKEIISRNAAGSAILKYAKKISHFLKATDIGIFIILVILFNTLWMMVLKRELDRFSILSRVGFFVIAVVLVFRKSRR